MDSSTKALKKVLKAKFGFTSFRPGQEKVIKALLTRQDVMALLPTGAGNSLCYQLPAQLWPGLTIVVSPLLALMKDQVESLEESGLDVSVINSLQSPSPAKEEMTKVVTVKAKILLCRRNALRMRTL